MPMKYEQIIEKDLPKAIQAYKWGMVVYVEKIYRDLQAQGYRITRKAIWRYVTRRLNEENQYIVVQQMHSNARMKIYLIKKELFEMVRPHLPNKIKIISKV